MNADIALKSGWHRYLFITFTPYLIWMKLYEVEIRQGDSPDTPGYHCMVIATMKTEQGKDVQFPSESVISEGFYLN